MTWNLQAHLSTVLAPWWVESGKQEDPCSAVQPADHPPAQLLRFHLPDAAAMRQAICAEAEKDEAHVYGHAYAHACKDAWMTSWGSGGLERQRGNG
jgi:hypothetical protein